MESAPSQHLVFRKGQWIRVSLPFSDPLLTPGHRHLAAAAVATELVRGASLEVATTAAETLLYKTLYPDLRIAGEQHDTPKH